MKEVKSTGLEPSEVVSEINRLRATLEKEKEKSNRILETANENYRLIAECSTGLMSSGNMKSKQIFQVPYLSILSKRYCLSVRRPALFPEGQS